ncbi:uncharacterized protein LOC131032025 isoform X2 [Cryptomeria japonica]|nr:uncharacterized protein LOC131032025 isoform X2 [Cryptomeria japonica]
MKCLEEDELPLFPERVNQNDIASDTLNVCKTLHAFTSTSWSKSVNFSCTTATSSVAPLPTEQTTSNCVPSEVNALPLFQSSDSSKPTGGVISGHDNDGLSLLGAAAFLSLGLDETCLQSAKRSICTDSRMDNSKGDTRCQESDIGIKMPCAATDDATTHGAIKQTFPVLGADLTLGLPMVVAESRRNQSIKDSDDDPLLLDEMDNIVETSQDMQVDNDCAHLDRTVNFGKQDAPEPPNRSDASACSLNADPQTIDDRLAHKDTVDQNRAGHGGTRRDYMHFSDLSVPLRGTLLLPRGQKRARRFPVPFRRLKNEVLQQKRDVGKKEPLSKFSRVTAPSGLLADLNPGIINRVRNSKQVHAIIEAVVGPDALTVCQDKQKNYIREPKVNPERKTLGASHPTFMVDNDHSEVVDMHNGSNDTLDRRQQLAGVEALKWKLDKRMIASMDACASLHLHSEDRPTDASVLDETFECLDASVDLIPPHCNGDQFYLKQVVGEHDNMKGTLNCHCHYCHPGEISGTDSTCSASLSRKAATMASHWLELYYQDVKGRLAALKRSRRRVRTLIKEVFSYAALYPTSSSHDTNEPLGKVNKTDKRAEHEHMEKWRSLFIHMDRRLTVEGTQLETSLQQIKGMQAHCKWGLQEVQGNQRDDHQLQQPEGLEDKLGPNLASAKTIERQYAVGAAAASIYSTTNFVLTAEDVPCF